MKYVNLEKEESKFFLLSGIVAFILIQVVGNYSVYGGLIAGLWLGFWGGMAVKKKPLEKEK